MIDDWAMTLPKIRRKYRNAIICPDKLREDCWNVKIADLVLTFHYFWEDSEGEYMNCITMDLNEDMSIAHIYPIDARRQDYWSIQRAGYSACRATELHYMELDMHMGNACISANDWGNMAEDDKLKAYKSALDYLSSWEAHNHLPQNAKSFIPVLKNYINSVKGDLT